jgi:hypothetical protein
VERRRRDRQHLGVLPPVLHSHKRQQFVKAELVDWAVDPRQPLRHAAQMNLAAECGRAIKRRPAGCIASSSCRRWLNAAPSSSPLGSSSVGGSASRRRDFKIGEPAAMTR